MPDMTRFDQRKWTRHKPNPNPNATTITSSATRGPVHSLPTELSRSASQRGTSGRGMSGTLSPPTNLLSCCWSTSTSEVFPAASASRRLGTARKGLCSVTRPESCRPLGNESPAFLVVGEAPGFVAVGQTPAAMAVGYTRASPGLAQVARLAERLPWYLHRHPMYWPCRPG